MTKERSPNTLGDRVRSADDPSGKGTAEWPGAGPVSEGGSAEEKNVPLLKKQQPIHLQKTVPHIQFDMYHGSCPRQKKKPTSSPPLLYFRTVQKATKHHFQNTIAAVNRTADFDSLRHTATFLPGDRNNRGVGKDGLFPLYQHTPGCSAPAGVPRRWTPPPASRSIPQTCKRFSSPANTLSPKGVGIIAASPSNRISGGEDAAQIIQQDSQMDLAEAIFLPEERELPKQLREIHGLLPDLLQDQLLHHIQSIECRWKIFQMALKYGPKIRKKRRSDLQPLFNIPGIGGDIRTPSRCCLLPNVVVPMADGFRNR